MTKGKETLKKNKEEWKEHKFIWEGFTYYVMSKKNEFHIVHEPTGRIVTKGELWNTKNYRIKLTYIGMI